MTLSSPKLWRIALFSILLAFACYWRAPAVREAWPFNYMEGVQLSSANAARTLWIQLKGGPSTPQEHLWVNTNPGRMVEPPVTQFLTALTYFHGNRETPWTSGIICGFFWLLAGYYLFNLIRELSHSEVESWTALAYFWLCPFGIVVSMSFQPESFLMLTTMISMTWLIRSDRVNSWSRTLTLSSLCGILALAKPGITLFPLLSIIVALELDEKGWKRALGQPKLAVFLLVCAIPSVAYFKFMFPRSPSLTVTESTSTLGTFAESFVSPAQAPSLILSTEMSDEISRVVGYLPLLLSLLGTLFFANRKAKACVVGILGGYLTNIVMFPWHAKSHDYYHILLIPVCAIGLSSAFHVFLKDLRFDSLAWRSRIIAGVVAAILLFRFGAPSHQRIAVSSFEDLSRYRQLSEKVPPGTRVVSATPYLSQDLRYFSWLRTPAWPFWLEVNLARYLRSAADVDIFTIALGRRYETRDLLVLKPDLIRHNLPLLNLLEQRPPHVFSESFALYQLDIPYRSPPEATVIRDLYL